jgi:predicted signal transduction protein with EAL and GGDEF domain
VARVVATAVHRSGRDLLRDRRRADAAGCSTGEPDVRGVGTQKEVAYLLRKQLRAFDLAYRLGGEEFLILLPGSDLQRSADLAERLRRGVCAEPVAGGVGVTMSFGVSASEQGEAFDYGTAFAKADEALYRAKGSGRDRVCLAGQQAAPQRSVAALA